MRPPACDPLLLVAGLVVAVLLVTAGLLTVRARSADRAEQARTEAIAAAEATAVDVLSYDYRHLDRDFARAKAGLTGDFVDDYAKTTRTVVRPTATEVKAVVKAEVAASSVVRADAEPGGGAAVREPDHHLDPAGRPEGRPEPGPDDHGPGGRPLAGEQGRRPLTPARTAADPAPDPAEVLDGERPRGSSCSRRDNSSDRPCGPHGRRRAT